MTAPSRHRPSATAEPAPAAVGDTAQLPRVRIDGGPSGPLEDDRPPGSRRSWNPVRSPRVAVALAVACVATAVAHFVLPPMPLGPATPVLVPVLAGIWVLAAVAFVVSAVVEHRHEEQERYPRMRRRPARGPWGRRA